MTHKGKSVIIPNRGTFIRPSSEVCPHVACSHLMRQFLVDSWLGSLSATLGLSKRLANNTYFRIYYFLCWESLTYTIKPRLYHNLKPNLHRWIPPSIVIRNQNLDQTVKDNSFLSINMVKFGTPIWN